MVDVVLNNKERRENYVDILLCRQLSTNERLTIWAVCYDVGI